MENLAMYILIAIMMVIAPGVDTILITKNTLTLGRRAGRFTTLGIATGLSVWTIVAVLGLAAIVAQSIVLFTTIKYLGAAYLIFIGIKTFMAKNTFSFEMNNLENNEVRNPYIGQYKKCFLQGFLSDALNPKTVIVYITLMPQFINPHQNVYLQLVILGAILIFTAIVWFLVVVYILDYIRIWFNKKEVQNIFNKLTGLMLVSLAVKLALEKR
ncbi:LysE family transporter [Dehalobacter sp. DCM]|uniref:LysE family translocator n=1 Tax=Dehalobacter sp. DCM TaxID=2907827 RepID=UPI003081301E|nr:LysE family transporter [Dehalobacter sp. DCM]